MIKNTPIEQRRRRTMELLEFLCKEKIEKLNLTVNKLAVYMASEWGLTQKKVKEYLIMHKRVGALTIDRSSGVIKITERGRRLAKGADIEDELFPIASIES